MPYGGVVSAPMLLATHETFARLPHSFGQHSGSILARVWGGRVQGFGLGVWSKASYLLRNSLPVALGPK